MDQDYNKTRTVVNVAVTGGVTIYLVSRQPPYHHKIRQITRWLIVSSLLTGLTWLAAKILQFL